MNFEIVFGNISQVIVDQVSGAGVRFGHVGKKQEQRPPFPSTIAL
jgi:hypothetical protein